MTVAQLIKKLQAWPKPQTKIKILGILDPMTDCSQVKWCDNAVILDYRKFNKSDSVILQGVES